MMVAATMEAERTAQDVVYSWSTTVGLGRVSPETAAAEMAALYERDGVVTPEAIVETARPPDAPLHAAFEWDDAVAAEIHRQEQARSLLRKLTVAYRRDDGTFTPPTRLIVKLQARPDEDEDDAVLGAATQPYAYIPISRVMDEAILRRKYVREAYLALASWRQRYQAIAEFARVHEAIDSLGDDFGAAAK